MISNIRPEQDLSRLEWDINEVHLDAATDGEAAAMLKSAIGILKAWKAELEANYPNTGFYLFAAYDCGDEWEPEEQGIPQKSITLRFGAKHDTACIINLSTFESWEQGAIVEYCNF